MNWNKIILHSLYVGGITFFSTISQLFTDGVLLNVDINNAIITSFIAMGLAFFTGWGVQNNDTYIPNIKVKRRKGLSLGFINFKHKLKNIVFL